MDQRPKQKLKAPLPGERTFIVREQSKHHRKLWLDRTFIAEIKLSPYTFQEITEETWKAILSVYVVEGVPCHNYVVERNFESLDELQSYLEGGGRITNLDESCSCYIRLIDNEFIFENGIRVENSVVVDHPTSFVPFYATPKMLEEEDKNIISGLLKLNNHIESK
jgi:hypothetical protein